LEVVVRVPTALAEVTAGNRTITVELADDEPTVAAVLDLVAATYPALERRIRDERGTVRTHVNLFVGADNVKDLDGLDSRIGPGDELSIIAAISGG
jgi:sulfur-carrier protein